MSVMYNRIIGHWCRLRRRDLLRQNWNVDKERDDGHPFIYSRRADCRGRRSCFDL